MTHAEAATQARKDARRHRIAATAHAANGNHRMAGRHAAVAERLEAHAALRDRIAA